MRLLILAATIIVICAVISACKYSESQSETAPTGSTPGASGTSSTTPHPVTKPVSRGTVFEIAEQGTYVLEVATGIVWRIDPEFSAYIGWLPRSGQLLRVGVDQGATPDTFQEVDRLDLHDGSAQRVFAGDFWHIAASSNGGSVGINRDAGTLRLLDLNTGSERELPIASTSAGVSWSPGDNVIASTDEHFVYLTSLSSGEISKISEELGPADIPVLVEWSPDGARLTFCFRAYPWNGDLSLVSTYLYDLSTRTWCRLGAFCDVRWSPDGTVFAYSDGGMIYVLNREGVEPPRLLAEGDAPAWSHEGGWLAFTRGSCEKPDNDIYAIRAGNSAIIKLTDSPQAVKESGWTGWSPTTNEIAYSVKLGDLSHALQIVGVDGRPPRTVLSSTSHFHGSQWSPDGRYLSFTLGVGHGAGAC